MDTDWLALPEEVSYIRPRDPSIENFNRNNLRRVRMNEQFSIDEDNEPMTTITTRDYKNCIQQKGVQIYLRVKPSTGNSEDYFIHENDLIYKAAEHDMRNAEGKESIYKKIGFSRILNSISKEQVKIFDDIVKIKVFEFINGKDTSIFTYGAAQSGKTYTTIGTVEEPGFLIRTLEYLFKTLPELPEIPAEKPTPDGKIIRLTQSQARSELNLKEIILKSQRVPDRLRNIEMYQSMQEKLINEPFASLEQLAEVSIGVWVSFAEIQNEEIFDLLQSSSNIGRKRLRIGVSNGKAYVSDLTHICVSNGLEAFQVYQYGIQTLKCMKENTNSNAHRSNSIFTIKIVHTLSNSDRIFISAFSICNLANCMDNALLVLGRCITSLKSSRENLNQKYLIPYRDSKLTQLFHRACLGLQDLCIIVHINFSNQNLRESYNILNFSALSKKVISKSEVLKYVALKSELSHELEHNIKELKAAIHERETFYEDLVENRSSNYELEKQTLIQGYEELLRDKWKYSETKKKNLEEEYERRYEVQLSQMRIGMQKKIEQKEKKKSQDELKYLKERYKSQKIEQKNLENQILELEKKLNKAKDLALTIENNEFVITELEDSVEKSDMDSFLTNEEKCKIKNVYIAEVGDTVERAEMDSFLTNEVNCRIKELVTAELEDSVENAEMDSLLTNNVNGKNKELVNAELEDSVEKSDMDSFLTNEEKCKINLYIAEVGDTVEKAEMDSFLTNEVNCENKELVMAELEGTVEKAEIDSFLINEGNCECNIEMKAE